MGMNTRVWKLPSAPIPDQTMVCSNIRLYMHKYKNENAPRFLAALLLMVSLRKRGRGAVAVCVHIHVCKRL